MLYDIVEEGKAVRGVWLASPVLCRMGSAVLPVRAPHRVPEHHPSTHLAHDHLQNNTVTVKNSPGRNLHRLMNSILFISLIFQNLANGQAMKEAVAGGGDRGEVPADALHLPAAGKHRESWVLSFAVR